MQQRVWTGVLLPPLSWVADFMARYLVIRFANIHDRRWPMAVCTFVALALLLVGVRLCWRARRQHTQGPTATLALWGLGLAGFFFILILAQAFPPLVIGPREISSVSGEAKPVLRVCADANNLPFSNGQGQGFENKIAERLAQALGAELHYTWWPQRRGFIRHTLGAGACDVIVGVPAALDAVAHTASYYRSSYVFVTRGGRAAIRSFDDPSLRHLRIGIPLIGDDGANPPPEAALARRGIIDNVIGYTVYGDYARADPALALLRAVASGEIDVAAAWGPQAGYFARHHPGGLALTPIAADPLTALPFTFDMTVGVRRGAADEPLRRRLDQALQTEREAITKILADYGIPRV